MWVCFGAKWNDTGPILNFAYFRPIPVLYRLRKVINIRLKHFSAVLTGNYKNCTAKHCGYPDMEKSSKFVENMFHPYWWETIRTLSQAMWVCFGCKTESFVSDFQVFLLWCFPDPQNLLKFDQNIFQSCWRETIRPHPKHCGYVWVQNGVVRGWFSTLPARGLFWWCPDSENSLKFNRNIF